MQCPHCNIQLVMSDRENIEIDYCPQCRGVWLDRGELDKIIERASGGQHTRTSSNEYRSHPKDYDDEHHERREHHDSNQYHGGHHKKHKKESFLGDLFDF